MVKEEITVHGLKIYLDEQADGYVQISSDEILATSAEGKNTLAVIKNALYAAQTEADREWDTASKEGQLGRCRNRRSCPGDRKQAIKPTPNIPPLEELKNTEASMSFTPASFREKDLADVREANKEARIPWCDMLGKPVAVGLGDKMNAGTVGRLNYVSCKYDSVPMGVVSPYDLDGNIIEGTTLSVDMKNLMPYPQKTDKVFWIIGLSTDCEDELGVEVNGVPHFYYKYSEASPSQNLVKDVDYRYIEKREFGEVIEKRR